MKRKKSARSLIHPAQLIGWIVFCELVGVMGAWFTAPAILTWYATLTKPVFNPPNWIFGPVWTTLYAMMGIAAYRIWRIGVEKSAARNAIVLFFIHMLFNAIWSPIFFGAHNIPLAFADISLTWITLIFVIFRFAVWDRLSAYLLLPYLAWVSFASVLNYNLWLLNP